MQAPQFASGAVASGALTSKNLGKHLWINYVFIYTQSGLLSHVSLFSPLQDKQLVEDVSQVAH